MDATDRKILKIIQNDASLSIAAIASLVGLSQTPCWKRIQKLELDGIIRRRVALLDARKLGLALTAFVTVEVDAHSREAQTQFTEAVSAMPEVLDVYRMAGEVDYLLRVVVSDTQTFDTFYQRLIDTVPLKKVTSRFALENIKAETTLPLQA